MERPFNIEKTVKRNALDERNREKDRSFKARMADVGVGS